MTARPAIDPDSVEIRPLTPERWSHVERLFGPVRGGHGGCWCQWFRLMRADYEALDRDGRKHRFADLVKHGPPPGILAYVDDLAVGWCAVAPRSSQPRLDKGIVSKRLGTDDYQQTWVITCLYVDTAWRRRGLMRPLVEGAVGFAKGQGARNVEAYPMIPHDRTSNLDLYVGELTTFLSCGFRQIAKPLPRRAVVRRAV